MIVCIDCRTCEIKMQCERICETVEILLPSMEAGRVDLEDLERIVAGKTMTNLILDNESVLTSRQQEVVCLYYRESMLERDIGEKLAISQQAVSDALISVKEKIWRMIRKRQAARNEVVAN